MQTVYMHLTFVLSGVENVHDLADTVEWILKVGHSVSTISSVIARFVFFQVFQLYFTVDFCSSLLSLNDCCSIGYQCSDSSFAALWGKKKVGLV